jgi:hypothetical protein
MGGDGVEAGLLTSEKEKLFIEGAPPFFAYDEDSVTAHSCRGAKRNPGALVVNESVRPSFCSSACASPRTLRRKPLEPDSDGLSNASRSFAVPTVAQASTAVEATLIAAPARGSSATTSTFVLLLPPLPPPPLPPPPPPPPPLPPPPPPPPPLPPPPPSPLPYFCT